MGPARVRRHPHRRDRSAPPCGVSCGPRAHGSGSPGNFTKAVATTSPRSRTTATPPRPWSGAWWASPPCATLISEERKHVAEDGQEIAKEGARRPERQHLERPADSLRFLQPPSIPRLSPLSPARPRSRCYPAPRARRPRRRLPVFQARGCPCVRVLADTTPQPKRRPCGRPTLPAGRHSRRGRSPLP